MKDLIKSYLGKIGVPVNPYKRVNDDFNMIYIHIPKAGGNVIYDCLFEMNGNGHKKLSEYYKYDKRKYEKYFKFTIVRNPYDRFTSAFNYLKRGGISEVDQKIFKSIFSEIEDINEFVSKLRSDTLLRVNVMNYIHFLPQSYFICDDIYSRSLDYIGYQESFEESFFFLQSQFGLENKVMKKVNVTNAPKIELNEESRDYVYELYKFDFELLGYER